MNIPNFIDRRTLAKMAAPDETHCVRVILQKVSNSAPYTVRSRLRRYVFERNGLAGCHVLDVPVSVWMQGVPTSGPYRQNPSISDDLQPTVQLPFTIQVIPWKAKVQAPPAVIEQSPPVEDTEEAEAPPVEDTEESPAAARARKMREAKAAKKNPQPES